jgi:hypothetical protein
MATIVNLPYNTALEVPTEMLPTLMEILASSKVLDRNYKNSGYHYTRVGQPLNIDVIIDGVVEEPVIEVAPDDAPKSAAPVVLCEDPNHIF